LHLEGGCAALQRIDVLRDAVQLHPQRRTGLVDQVDGLVGQESRGDVAVAELRRHDQRAVRDTHAVVAAVALAQAAQYVDGVRHGRLIHQHLRWVTIAEPRRIGAVGS
jgi:hypothetical protein